MKAKPAGEVMCVFTSFTLEYVTSRLITMNLALIRASYRDNTSFDAYTTTVRAGVTISQQRGKHAGFGDS